MVFLLASGGFAFSTQGLNDAGQIAFLAETANGISAIYRADPDNDGDGVPVNVDVCSDTVIPETVPTVRLGVNRFALTDGDGDFDTTAPMGRGPQKSFTIEDTEGCSCEQIIEVLGLGKGHSKFGCSISAMEDFIAQVDNTGGSP